MECRSMEARPGGAMYGEGQGVLMSKDGQEMATWTGQGIGRFTSPGKIRFTGSLFFSRSSTGKLAYLNNLVGVFEYQSDESGNTHKWIVQVLLFNKET